MSQPDTLKPRRLGHGFVRLGAFLPRLFDGRARLVAFEAFLTSLPFADAIPDYAEELQQRQLDSYFQMIQLLITWPRSPWAALPAT